MLEHKWNTETRNVTKCLKYEHWLTDYERSWPQTEQRLKPHGMKAQEVERVPKRSRALEVESCTQRLTWRRLWGPVRPCSVVDVPDVSEEYIATIFRVGVYCKWATGKQSSVYHLLLVWLTLWPWWWGDMFFWNVVRPLPKSTAIGSVCVVGSVEQWRTEERTAALNVSVKANCPLQRRSLLQTGNSLPRIRIGGGNWL
jgi:hypothetical protein